MNVNKCLKLCTTASNKVNYAQRMQLTFLSDAIST